MHEDLCFSHAADVETWDKMITLNLLVPMKLTHALGPSLAHSRAGGHIINISSVAGLRASKYNAAYSASKWGLTGWSKACFEVGGHPSKALQLAAMRHCKRFSGPGGDCMHHPYDSFTVTEQQRLVLL